MNLASAVEFPTQSRVHMGLAVRNLERSLAFYSVLFGQGPSKTRPNYAKFEVTEPPVNLSLNEVGGDTGPNNTALHYGIQVKSTDAVQRMRVRLETAGIDTEIEERVSCCYAVQSKVWAVDPDGNKWETFVVLDNNGPQHASPASGCCQNTSVACAPLAPV